jgi:hypothetical protein
VQIIKTAMSKNKSFFSPLKKQKKRQRRKEHLSIFSPPTINHLGIIAVISSRTQLSYADIGFSMCPTTEAYPKLSSKTQQSSVLLSLI